MNTFLNELKENFLGEKLKNFNEFYKNSFKDLDYIFIKNGEDVEDVKKIKTCAFQSYLFKKELVNTMLLISKDQFWVFGKNLEIPVLKSFEETFFNAGYKLKIISINDNEIDKKFNLLNEFIKKENLKKVGTLIREEPKGELSNIFNKNYSECTFVDISSNLQDFLSIKNKNDINLIHKCSELNIDLFKYLRHKIENSIHKSLTHVEISEMVEKHFNDNRKKFMNSYNLRENKFDIAYQPIIQSGNKFDLRPIAESNTDKISFDVITLSLGCDYSKLHSNIIRTLLIKPDEETKDLYNILFEAHNLLVNRLKPGKIIKEIYQEVSEFLISKDKSLEKNIPKNFGYGMGYEFKENSILINANNERTVKENMVFHATMNLGNILNGKAFMIGDLIVVKSDSNENLTKKINKNLDFICYDLDDHKKKDAKKKVEKEKEEEEVEEEGYDRKQRFRDKKRKIEEMEFKHGKIKEMQESLLKQKTQEIIERHKNGKFLLSNEENNVFNLGNLNCYTEKTVPKNLKTNEIYIDSNKYCVFFPINKKLVPFHVMCIKNSSIFNDEKNYLFRINFIHPGYGGSSIKYPDFSDANINPIYVKQLIYKSSNTSKFTDIHTKIKNLQKEYKLKDINNCNNIITSDQLKGRIKTLKDLKIKPNISGKKTYGDLVAYKNGLKFQSKKGEEILIAVDNIKNIFFQPCDDDELCVLLHFHLKKPIIIKRKTYIDFQFYIEIGSKFDDLTDRRRYNEIDEIHEEKKIKNSIKHNNDLFKNFVHLIKDNMDSNIEIDIPYKNLGFDGSVNSNSTFITPTSKCLVCFEQPFFIIEISEIELVSLERIDNKLKSFDLIIIFRDYKRPIKSISSIPKLSLDDIKQWLISVKIPFVEGESLNVNWKNLLKGIVDNPENFIEDGCWEALLDDNEDEDESKQSNYSDDSEFNESKEDDDEDDYMNESDFTENDSDLDEGEEEEYDDDDDESDVESEDSSRNKKRKR